MSLLLWDPILGGGRRRYNPWAVAPRHYHIPDPLELAQRQLEQMDRMVDQFFDTDMNIQLRDNVGRLSVSDRGDLTYQVDVSGYRPEELKVEMQGNELVLQGEHKEQNQGESVHRQFVRRLLIPEDINRESIKCDLSTDGRLCVTGKKQQGDMPRSIPIQIGMGSQPAAIGGQQQQKQQPEAIEQDQQQVKQQNGPANVGQQQAQKAH